MTEGTRGYSSQSPSYPTIVERKQTSRSILAVGKFGLRREGSESTENFRERAPIKVADNKARLTTVKAINIEQENMLTIWRR